MEDRERGDGRRQCIRCDYVPGKYVQNGGSISIRWGYYESLRWEMRPQKPAGNYLG